MSLRAPPSEQPRHRKSFATPFRTLSARAAAAPSTDVKLPTSPRLSRGTPASISAPLAGQLLDSRPPDGRAAIARVEQHLQRFEMRPALAPLPVQVQAPARKPTAAQAAGRGPKLSGRDTNDAGGVLLRWAGPLILCSALHSQARKLWCKPTSKHRGRALSLWRAVNWATLSRAGQAAWALPTPCNMPCGQPTPQHHSSPPGCNPSFSVALPIWTAP